jgi:hypothetical protein
MASDGGWYPPEQHPDAAHRARYPASIPQVPSDVTSGSSLTPSTSVLPPLPPVPPPGTATPVQLDAPAEPRAIAPQDRPSSGRLGPLIGAVVLVIAVGIGAFVIAGGDDDGGSATTDDDDTSTTATIDVGGDDEADEPDGDDSGGGGEALEVAGVAVELPEGWLAAEVGSGIEGDDLFADDPQAASIVDTALATLPADAVLFALDPDIGSGSNLNLQVADEPDGGLEGAVEAGRTVLETNDGFEIESDRSIEIDGEDAHTFLFTFASGDAPVQSIVQVVVVLDGQLVVLTMSTLDPARYDAVFQEIADSLKAA